MQKEDLIKLTEALAQAGYNIETLKALVNPENPYANIELELSPRIYKNPDKL